MAETATGALTATKLRTDTLVKLLAAAKDLHDKQGELLAEIDALLGGKPGIGTKIKTFQTGYDAAWCSRYAPGQHGRYIWRATIDVPNIKRLLKSLEVEDLIERAQRYVRSNDDFHVRGRHNFGLFVSSINAWARSSDAPAGDFELQRQVADCKHDPPCTTDQEHTRRRAREMRS